MQADQRNIHPKNLTAKAQKYEARKGNNELSKKFQAVDFFAKLCFFCAFAVNGCFFQVHCFETKKGGGRLSPDALFCFAAGSGSVQRFENATQGAFEKWRAANNLSIAVAQLSRQCFGRD